MKKNKKGQDFNNMAIMALIFVVLSIVLYAVVAELITDNTTTTTVASESVTGSNVSNVQFDNPDWSINATCNCTDFDASFTAGTAIWGNDTCNGQTVVCSYAYFPGAYVDNSTSRSILTILPLLLIVGIFIGLIFVLRFNG